MFSLFLFLDLVNQFHLETFDFQIHILFLPILLHSKVLYIFQDILCFHFIFDFLHLLFLFLFLELSIQDPFSFSFFESFLSLSPLFVLLILYLLIRCILLSGLFFLLNSFVTFTVFQLILHQLNQFISPGSFFIADVSSLLINLMHQVSAAWRLVLLDHFFLSLNLFQIFIFFKLLGTLLSKVLHFLFLPL